MQHLGGSRRIESELRNLCVTVEFSRSNSTYKLKLVFDVAQAQHENEIARQKDAAEAKACFESLLQSGHEIIEVRRPPKYHSAYRIHWASILAPRGQQANDGGHRLPTTGTY